MSHNQDDGMHGAERVAPEGVAAGEMAGELLVDGLLRHVQQRDTGARRLRIRRVMKDVIDETDGGVVGGCERGVLARFPGAMRKVARPLMALAALIAIVVLVMQFGVPGESRAVAQLNSVIAASRAAEALRYEVRIGGEVNATIDSGPGGLLVVKHRPPWVKEAIYCGRDGQGDWAMTYEGKLTRENPRRFWPPWSTDGETHFVDSIDRLMENFTKGYDIASQKGADGGEQIVASRRGREGPYPHRVVITVHAESKVAERIEFQWDGRDAKRGTVFTRMPLDGFTEGWFDAARYVK